MHLWSKNEFKNIYKQFKFKFVIQSIDALCEWIEALSEYGCVLLTDAPPKEDQCNLLAEPIGFVRQTHYGVQYAIRVKKRSNNIAYLNEPLQMHNDITFYDYVPGVTALHCIEQTKSPGAFNLLTDAFNAAERLRSEHPEYFNILSTTMVNWSDYGVEDGYTFLTINRAPVIYLVSFFCFVKTNFQYYIDCFYLFSLDHEGKMERINQNVAMRDSFLMLKQKK